MTDINKKLINILFFYLNIAVTIFEIDGEIYKYI